MESEPGALPLDRRWPAFWVSSSVGTLFRDSLVGTWGRHSMASLLMLDGRLRTLLNCSAHLLRIFSFSVIRDAPSALRSGEVPDDEGP